MKIFTSALVCLYILSGCATHEYARINNDTEDAIDNYVSCLNSTADNTPIRKRLKRIFIFEAHNDPNKDTKLAINRYITEEESKDLSEYAELREPCRKLVINEMKKAHPDIAMVFVETFTESNTQTDKLIKKQITIGEGNQMIVDMTDRAKQRFEQLDQRLRKRLLPHRPLSSLSRDKNQISKQKENNDLNVKSTAYQKESNNLNVKSTAYRLQELKKLYQSGLITEKEYNLKRSEIIDEL